MVGLCIVRQRGLAANPKDAVLTIVKNGIRRRANVKRRQSESSTCPYNTNLVREGRFTPEGFRLLSDIETVIDINVADNSFAYLLVQCFTKSKVETKQTKQTKKNQLIAALKRLRIRRAH